MHFTFRASGQAIFMHCKEPPPPTPLLTIWMRTCMYTLVQAHDSTRQTFCLKIKYFSFLRLGCFRLAHAFPVILCLNLPEHAAEMHQKQTELDGNLFFQEMKRFTLDRDDSGSAGGCPGLSAFWTNKPEHNWFRVLRQESSEQEEQHKDIRC